jgi:hypothetical protein
MSLWGRAMRRPSVPGRIVGAAALFALVALPVAGQEEKPVSTESVSRGSLLPALGEDPSRQLSITGFGVGTYSYNFSTGQNSFSDSALALAFSKVLSDHLSVFAQLTAARGAASPFFYDAPASDIGTDIDNLMVTWSPSPRSGLSITFGKFDSPLGLERDDAPLNFQATSSFTFSYARPVKFTGIQIHEAFSPEFELWGIAANGWDNDLDNNKGKTGALYGMWSPSLSAHVGLGVIYGPESDGTNSDPRSAGVLTLLFQPTARWVVGGEFIAGRQSHATDLGGTARWYAGTLFTHHRFGDHWATTLRVDYLDDQSGFRTGARQVLRSLTLSPQYLVGGGFYGIFRYLDRTSLRLPEFQLRMDLRYDRSTEPTLRSKSADVGRRDNVSATFQTVFLF